jgi:N-acetyl-anhydromuramyl-L-alanine amidase AmpD
MPGSLSIDRTKYRLPATQYWPSECTKDLIVLHFTAGTSAEGAFSSWASTPLRVATAYLVDTNGAVYETFDPKHWAHHLGIPGAVAQDFRHEKRAIGIEIVNAGPLRLAPGKTSLHWWPPSNGQGQPTYRTKFCTLAQTTKYARKTFRGEKFYAAFPEDQMIQVVALVNHLCEHFSIPKRIPAAGKRGEFDLPFASAFSGVLSHQSFRSDKYDVGPAFDWDRLFR